MTMLGTLFALPLYAGFTAQGCSTAHFPYFSLWNLFTGVCLVLSTFNVDWAVTHPALGVAVVLIQGMLHWSVLEIPLQTIATLLTSPNKVSRADRGQLSLVLNYNLLAVTRPDIDDCFENMFQAFMGNLDERVSAVLVSATNEASLREYELQVRDQCRRRIYETLLVEGKCWAGLSSGPVDAGRAKRVWSQLESLKGSDDVVHELESICKAFSEQFMVLHRVSRVLRKCGQYQDLMLLSSGEDKAFTYCDTSLYGDAARAQGEPLFRASPDMDKVRGRNFDYTLVLDNDTQVEQGSVFDMLEIAAAHPDRAIIQPAIKMTCDSGDSMFMHLEAMRQHIHEPMNSTVTSILGESSFYGKGLIKNSVYVDKCLGTRSKLIEAVPIDVLSHDTFEAAVLRPLYASDVQLLESPCHNYVTWDIRERRWNRGELLLAMYFWPTLIGAPMRFLQYIFQGGKFNRTEVRTKSDLDKVSSYFAHAALRQMIMKPLLVSYIVMVDFVEMHFEWLPIITVMFLIIVFPKFAVCSRKNIRGVMLETLASVLQFTPESVVGTIRVLRALKAHLTGNAKWVPQRAVEDEFKVSNPIIFSLRYMWYYMMFAVACGFLVMKLIPEAIFIMTMLATLFILPIYAGITGCAIFYASDSKDVQGVVNFEGGHKVQLCKAEPMLKDSDAASVGVVCVTDIAPIDQAAEWDPANGSLSEGDRNRIALARAAYEKSSNLVLLDDPFANYDVETKGHVLNELATNELFLNRTRIVALEADPDSLSAFDRVVILSHGRIMADGPTSDVLEGKAFKDLVTKQQEQMKDSVVSKPESINSPVKIQPVPVEATPPKSVSNVLMAALEAGGPTRLALAIMTVALLRVAAQGQMLILGHWADEKQTRHMQGDKKYIEIMLALVVAVSILQLLQGYFLQAFNESVSQKTFMEAFSKVMGATKTQFWAKQPVGRIINRLSMDVLNIDLLFTAKFTAMSGFIFSVAVQQVYCLVVMPWWLLLSTYSVIIILCGITWNALVPMQEKSLTALSKCHAEQLDASVTGAGARAYGCHDTMMKKYCARVGEVVAANFLSGTCMRQWIVLRICFCLCFQCTVCVLFGMLRPTMVGLGTLTVIVASTFNIVQELDNFVEMAFSGSSVAISLQRLNEYAELEQEAEEDI